MFRNNGKHAIATFCICFLRPHVDSRFCFSRYLVELFLSIARDDYDNHSGNSQACHYLIKTLYEPDKTLQNALQDPLYCVINPFKGPYHLLIISPDI